MLKLIKVVVVGEVMEENTDTTETESYGLDDLHTISSTDEEMKSVQLQGYLLKDSQASSTMTEKHPSGMENISAEHDFENPDFNGESDSLNKEYEVEKDNVVLVAGIASHVHQSLTENDVTREIQPALKENAPPSAEHDAPVNQTDSLQLQSVTMHISTVKQQSPDEVLKLSLSSVGLQSEQEREATADSLQTPSAKSQSVLQDNILTDSQYLSTSSQEFSREDHQFKADPFQSCECEMPGNPQPPLKVHESSSVESQRKLKEESSGDSRTFMHTKPNKTDSLQNSDENQTYPENLTATENQSLTGYLDDVISSIQTLAWNQSEAVKDNVQISRAELTFMVQQTLVAQTMCIHLQELVQKNMMLNQQNEVLKETVAERRQWQGDGSKGDLQPQSLLVYSQGPEAQVFRFDGCPLPPVALPPTLDQTSSSSDSHASSEPDRNKGPRSPRPGREDMASLLQADGEAVSGSLQRPSDLGFDGDSSLGSKHDKEASAAANMLPFQLSATGNDEAGASVSAQGPNIPNEVLFEGAQLYSTGPQQNEEATGGSAGVSQDQYTRVSDELEKTKVFVNKICKEGGLHPNDYNVSILLL